MAKPRYRIVAVADMHSGSQRAPWILASEGTPSHRLYMMWQAMKLNVGKVDAVLALGDLADGTNYFDGGKGQTTTDVMEQTANAAKLLAMLNPRGSFYLVAGTKYHVGSNPCSDDLVAQALRLELALAGRDNQVKFHDEMVLKFPTADHDVRIHIAHKIGCSSLRLGTPALTEMLAATTAVPLVGPVDLQIRGHRHCYFYGEQSRTAVLMLPGWKLRDEYLAKSGSLAWVPEIGYVVIEIYDNGRVICTPHTWIVKDQIPEEQVGE